MVSGVAVMMKCINCNGDLSLFPSYFRDTKLLSGWIRMCKWKLHRQQPAVQLHQRVWWQLRRRLVVWSRLNMFVKQTTCDLHSESAHCETEYVNFFVVVTGGVKPAIVAACDTSDINQQLFWWQCVSVIPNTCSKVVKYSQFLYSIWKQFWYILYTLYELAGLLVITESKYVWCLSTTISNKNCHSPVTIFVEHGNVLLFYQYWDIADCCQQYI